MCYMRLHFIYTACGYVTIDIFLRFFLEAIRLMLLISHLTIGPELYRHYEIEATHITYPDETSYGHSHVGTSVLILVFCLSMGAIDLGIPSELDIISEKTLN